MSVTNSYIAFGRARHRTKSLDYKRMLSLRFSCWRKCVIVERTSASNFTSRKLNHRLLEDGIRDRHTADNGIILLDPGSGQNAIEFGIQYNQQDVRSTRLINLEQDINKSSRFKIVPRSLYGRSHLYPRPFQVLDNSS